ncbi:MAG: class I SAM-dependent methyltransferase [Limnobacter sp.]|nr:class I SAM-dependent methyltransferase [Limnobacter sp.]
MSNHPSAVQPQAFVQWEENGLVHTALWQTERGSAPPKRVVLADDTLSADTAYRLACEGTALLWCSDFQNARQLIQAMARRIEKNVEKKLSKKGKEAKRGAAKASASQDADTNSKSEQLSPAHAFHAHRLAQLQRSKILSSVLIPLADDYTVPLRRAPDIQEVCEQSWGPASALHLPPVTIDPNAPPEEEKPYDAGMEAGSASDQLNKPIRILTPLREIQGLIGAYEWRRKGLEIPELGKPPYNRIHPYYGVYSPVRGEYLELVAKAPIPQVEGGVLAFDIGTGTGVLTALLLHRGVLKVVATETEDRALECAAFNFENLQCGSMVQLVKADLFPEGKANLIVCNPPWIPAKASAPIERAVYDEGSHMLMGFINGLAQHLLPKGEGWLILSDIAEHLGLRTRDELLQAIDAAGLKLLGKSDIKPRHAKAIDPSDPLHKARSKEVTSLWRLGVK